MFVQNHRETQIRIKREKRDKQAQQRRQARPRQGDVQLEIDDDGHVRERPTSRLPPREVVEID